MIQAIDSKPNPLTPADAEALLKQAHPSLVAFEDGEGFPKPYLEALQRDHDVGLAHAQATKLFLGKIRRPTDSSLL